VSRALTTSDRRRSQQPRREQHERHGLRHRHRLRLRHRLDGHDRHERLRELLVDHHGLVGVVVVLIAVVVLVAVGVVVAVVAVVVVLVVIVLAARRAIVQIREVRLFGPLPTQFGFRERLAHAGHIPNDAGVGELRDAESRDQ
jgi:Flp pilus assembly protein TadB